MQTDLALQAILPYLQNIREPTLWYADENAEALIDKVSTNKLLTVVSNRYDIYEKAISKNINAIFSDFNPQDYIKHHSQEKFTHIVYRISKEKALVNFLCNQAADLLTHNGKFIISGYKQEGIKSYAGNITKHLKAQGQLKKIGASYLGEFCNLSQNEKLDDKQYSSIIKVSKPSLENGYFYSKPGVFGWNKIDKGTELLLLEVKKIFSHEIKTRKEGKNVKELLDLGCGYGWIFLNIAQNTRLSITATDNNAAALLCAEKNKMQCPTPELIEVIAGDCANTIQKQYDFVLCNPPFHQGFKHAKALTTKFIHACKHKLKPSGLAIFVLNEFVTIDEDIDQASLKQTLLNKSSGFKVVSLQHR